MEDWVEDWVEDWALPEIDLQRCDQCGTCMEECPAGAVQMGEEGPVLVRPADCTYCALCDAICPQGAITCAYEIVWGEDSLEEANRRPNRSTR